MEKLLDTGKVKSIGVSNFSVKTFQELLPHCKVVPAVNQVEMHPCLPQEELKAYCEEKDILLVAYCPLGQSYPVFLDQLKGIASKHDATPAQIALSWGVQRGTAVIPKSENEGRMTENISIRISPPRCHLTENLNLFRTWNGMMQLIQSSDEDLAAINAIHKQPGMHKTLSYYDPPDGLLFGWTYEQLGWPIKKGGIVEQS